MKYSIIIPTYNHCNDLLRPCIDAVFKFSNVSDIELIISANGCTDNTLEYLGSLKEKFNYLGLSDNMKIIWHDKPIGFSKAVNAGIRVATTDKIVLLNNDAILMDQRKNFWLSALESSFIQHEKCGVSCVLLRHSEITKREFAVFFCVMIGKRLIDTIGLLDERFATGGCEDIDYCMRAELAGFEVHQPIQMIWDPEVKLHVGSFPVYHQGEGTVFDASLVPGWSNIFWQNELKLAEKYNQEWFNENKGKR